MANVFDAAHYILSTIGGDVSTVKLQKLCYYAQAWHLARYGAPLFPEEFEKWDNGPVCRELYLVHRGNFSINAESIPGELCLSEDFSADECGTMDLVLEKYGVLDGDELSKLSHREDPWKLSPKNSVISKNVMETYYFDQWAQDDCDAEDTAVTEERLNHEIAAAQSSPVYKSSKEMFDAILGHGTASEALS
jgi:uncharacterized phage-associated protein